MAEMRQNIHLNKIQQADGEILIDLEPLIETE